MTQMLAIPVTDEERSAWDAALQGGALRALVAERREQLRRGHDSDADALLPLDRLPRTAKDYLVIALECIRGIDGQQDLRRARRKLVQSAALLMAAIDRLDAAVKVAADEQYEAEGRAW